MGDEYLALSARPARPRSGHGVRGGRVPEHLRVLVRRDGHLHDQRLTLYPRLRLLPGRHRPPAPTRLPASRPGWPSGASAWDWPTRSSPAWPATTCPTVGQAALPDAIAVDQGPHAPDHRSRCSSRTARVTSSRWPSCSTLGPMCSTTTSRQWPDSSGWCGRRPATPGAWQCWPGPRMPDSPPSRGSSSAWASGKDEVLATLADLRAVGVDIVTVGQYLRPTRRPSAGGPLVDPRGVRGHR